MRKVLIVFVFFLLTNSSHAQFQVGIFGGVANYQGDLVDQAFQSPRGAVGFTVNYEASGRLSLRGGFTYAKLAGADSLSKKADLRLRNLSFQTAISELSLVGEFNTLNLDERRWSPYVFAGLAVFHFNPYAYDRTGRKVFLRPLSTEGQDLSGYPDSKSYSLTQLAIPFGGGIKLNVNDRVRIALELGMRKLFTDYLDDVSGNYADPNDLLAAKGPQSVDLSYRGDEAPGGNLNYPLKGAQRGSPKYKDFYYITGLHLIYRLPGSTNSLRENSYSGKLPKKGRYGCPTVF
ncbi:MAG TPA: DUF6089 family protein [Flavisolibacter sp.]|nr:DUF6089 family protein [Flavisolibacter sp.]